MAKTIKSKVFFEGVGLHTGVKVRMEISPRKERGLIFVRADLEGAPEIPARVEFISSVERGSVLSKDGITVNTVEHVLSALWGMGVSSAKISLWGPEPPALDGSALPFAQKINEVGTEEIGEPEKAKGLRDIAVLREKDVEIIGIPKEKGLEVSFGISYPRTPIGSQYINLILDPNTYLEEIAPARTYVIHEDIESLKAKGLAKGGSPENTVVFSKDRILTGPLRFNDEPVRHKVLDLIGDLALLGYPINAHILAQKSGHRHHVAFVKILKDHLDSDFFDIYDILKWMPHRYPFLLVDRIVRLENDEVVGYKNVTFNEPFFTGHFPSNPVMPGVLILEAMAQVGGFLLLHRVKEPHKKLLYFAGADKVRFRRPVKPGDRIFFKLRLLRFGGKNAMMSGEARVDGELTASATLMATIMER